MNDNEFDWNQCYSGEASDCEAPNPLLLGLAEGLSPGRALDIGCGAGGLALALAERGWRVTGVDLASRAIDAAKKAAAERGLEVELHTGDARRWQPTGKYDLVVSSFALPGDAPGRADVFAMAQGALRAGGVIALEDFDAGMCSVNAHFAEFDSPTVEELTSAFSGFEILRAEVVETPPHDHDGKGTHAGERWTAAVLHARKPAV